MKILITEKQVEQFNRMREALRRIGAVKGERTTYMTPNQIRKESKKDRINYDDELEMAYENMQADAKQAVSGIRSIIITTE